MSTAGNLQAGVGPARVRISSPDQYAGLRGKEYLHARGLSKRIAFKGQPSTTDDCQCHLCIRERLLPAVLRICAAHDRRQPAIPATPDWNTYSDEALHVLTDHPELASE